MRFAEFYSLKLTMTLFIILATACGTQAGNPKKPGDEIVIPDIKYDVPSSVVGESSLMLAHSDLNLSEDNCTSLFHCKARRAHQIVRGINAVIKRIRDTDKIRSAGDFRDKGPGRNISGKIEVIEDGDFERSTTMCFKNKVFLHMKWSQDGSKIAVTRDFSADPLSDFIARVGKSRVEFTKTATESILDFRTESAWDSPPGQTTDGEILNEHIISKVDAEKNVTITSVNDWYATRPTVFEGDHYLTGKMDAAGLGEFVTYIKSGLCSINGFDEAAPDLWDPTYTPGDPRWCYGRKVETGTLFNNSQLTAALARLEPIGILSSDTLGTVDFDVDVRCD